MAKLTKKALTDAIAATAERIDRDEAKGVEMMEKGATLADLNRTRHHPNNARQRRAWLASIAKLPDAEVALLAELLPSWMAFTDPADLYNTRDAVVQYVRAALGGPLPRTAFRDFLATFARKKADTLDVEAFASGVLRTDSDSRPGFYTGPTAKRWAKGCGAALEMLGGATLSGSRKAPIVTLNRESRIVTMLEEAGYFKASA